MATVSPNLVGLSAEGAEVNVGCRREQSLNLEEGSMEFVRYAARRRGTPEPAGISGNGYSITEYGRFERRGSRGKRGLSPRAEFELGGGEHGICPLRSETPRNTRTSRHFGQWLQYHRIW